MVEEFSVWKVDTKPRPCFGTIEEDEKIKYRSLLSEEGTKVQKRVIAILNTLKGADIPLNVEGAMTYSNKEWMTMQVFHIKYVMPPDVYLEKYWPRLSKEELSVLENPKKMPDKAVLKENHDIDYYGGYLRDLRSYNEAKVENISGKLKGVILVRAKDEWLKETGPVVLLKREPLTCTDLKDEDLRDFEKAIIEYFGKGVENFGFSVCIYVVEHDESPLKAKICIGAKIHEEKFIDAINPSDDIKKSFLRKHTYKEKKKNYQCKYVVAEKKPHRLN